MRAPMPRITPNYGGHNSYISYPTSGQLYIWGSPSIDLQSQYIAEQSLLVIFTEIEKPYSLLHPSTWVNSSVVDKVEFDAVKRKTFKNHQLLRDYSQK